MKDKLTKRKRELLKVSRTEIKTEVTRKVVTEVVNTEVALDATNAGELIAELSALRDAIDANETKVEGKSLLSTTPSLIRTLLSQTSLNLMKF